MMMLSFPHCFRFCTSFLLKDVQTISSFFQRKGVKVASTEDMMQLVRHVGYEDDKAEDAKRVIDAMLDQGFSYAQAIEGTSYSAVVVAEDNDEEEEHEDVTGSGSREVVEEVSWEGRAASRTPQKEDRVPTVIRHK